MDHQPAKWIIGDKFYEWVCFRVVLCNIVKELSPIKSLPDNDYVRLVYYILLPQAAVKGIYCGLLRFIHDTLASGDKEYLINYLKQEPEYVELFSRFVKEKVEDKDKYEFKDCLTTEGLEALELSPLYVSEMIIRHYGFTARDFKEEWKTNEDEHFRKFGESFEKLIKLGLLN